jgi:hypothetical protein
MLLLRFTVLASVLSSYHARDGYLRRNLYAKIKVPTTVGNGKSVAFSCSNGGVYGVDNVCTYDKNDWSRVESIRPHTGTLNFCQSPSCKIVCDQSCLVQYVQGSGPQAGPGEDGQDVGAASTPQLGSGTVVEQSRSVQYWCMNGDAYGWENRCIAEGEFRSVPSGDLSKGVFDFCESPGGCLVRCTKFCMTKFVTPSSSAGTGGGGVSGASQEGTGDVTGASEGAGGGDGTGGSGGHSGYYPPKGTVIITTPTGTRTEETVGGASLGGGQEGDGSVGGGNYVPYRPRGEPRPPLPPPGSRAGGGSKKRGGNSRKL